MNIRKQPLLCPHCKTKLGFKVYSKYFVYGTEHVERCPHCNGSIKPEKEPLPTFKCVQFGSFFAIITSVSYLIFIEDNLLHAMLFSTLLFLIPLGGMCILTYQRINFVRTE